MKIQWSIQKKRGNHRPVLEYRIELEQFEIDLAVPQVLLDKALSRPPSSWRSFCYPGEDERSGVALDWYPLMTPSHKNAVISGKLTLPWRPAGNEFVDIKVAFGRLRKDFELVLAKANESAPVEIVEHLELTEDTRKHIAAGVASARFLSAVGF
ncbi:hypothetical protein [Pseudodesulfovibrio piezophilus]|uniref:Uncharacterized protein n=1 Tax=Pseudodesulfovibrio piezophilus (strain DSM 21447 / JCM 15486 / C1TLV30) TaxID=1322246 RepID=M1WSF6_PSEP2|nr:hypothetical protein [Pseudodesulfovibrio piezophilus]CCH50164.1 conserved protein of unknown function [Pseudodesulfovibrio piezophilus C1TLV30]